MSGMLRSIQGETDWFNNSIAIMVAVVSACLAVANIKNGNISQVAQQEQRNAASSWNQYQAKRLRQFALEVRLQDLSVQPAEVAEARTPDQLALIERWRSKNVEYKRELKELAAKARAHEAQQKELALRDDDYDVAEAFLTLTLALLAVAALTRSRWLLALGFLVGGVSVFFTGSAFAGWQAFHPAWLLSALGV